MTPLLKVAFGNPLGSTFWPVSLLLQSQILTKLGNIDEKKNSFPYSHLFLIKKFDGETCLFFAFLHIKTTCIQRSTQASN